MTETRDLVDEMDLEERIERAAASQKPMTFEELIGPETCPMTGIVEELIWDEEIYGLIAKRTQDCTAIIDNNREIQNWSRDRVWKSKEDKWMMFASIPNIIIEQWLKEGVDVYRAKCDRNGVPNDHMRAVLKRLRDPDWRWLKTTELDMGTGKQTGNFRLAHVPGNGLIWGAKHSA